MSMVGAEAAVQHQLGLPQAEAPACLQVKIILRISFALLHPLRTRLRLSYGLCLCHSEIHYFSFLPNIIPPKIVSCSNHSIQPSGNHKFHYLLSSFYTFICSMSFKTPNIQYQTQIQEMPAHLQPTTRVHNPNPSPVRPHKEKRVFTSHNPQACGHAEVLVYIPTPGELLQEEVNSSQHTRFRDREATTTLNEDKYQTTDSECLRINGTE